MGCSTSKLDDEEVVQLCRDRKRFIKEAVEQRLRFASGHIAYVQSLKRVAAALRNYVEGDEPREFFLDSFTTPPFTPIKKTSPVLISIGSKSFSTPIQSGTNSSFKVSYLRSGGNPAVSVEERPPSPENRRVESYPPMHHFGIDGFFGMQSSYMNSSSFYSPSPSNGPSYPPATPPNSQWDFFWNPFTSLDTYGYPTRSSIDHRSIDDDIVGLRQVREKEGIPDLEEEGTEDEENKGRVSEERTKVDMNFAREEVTVEDLAETDSECECKSECASDTDTDHDSKGRQSHGRRSVEASEPPNVEVSKQETSVVGNQDSKEETPGFTVYVNRRPTSMAEVIKDIESQFMIVCNSANEVSAMLEASRAQYSSTPTELSASKMLNPVALFRSASSRSSSSRFFLHTSSSHDDGCDSNSDFSEESCMFSGSHQSTLDRLYAWEKKLYVEVKSGERIRVAYEKKCNQLRNQDVKGDDPSSVDKTRAAIRDLRTQIKVSIHSVEAVSKRIETLRDEELQPQILELIQGLARMWKVMAECHQFQKRTVDEAKLLLAGTPPKFGSRRHTNFLPTDPNRLAQSAATLESELRNWRACFESWIIAQRSYLHAITGWLLRCVQCDSDTSKLPFSPRQSNGAPPVFGICIQWSRFLDSIRENPVIDGMDFFAAGMGSLYANQLREDSRRTPMGSKRFGVGFTPDSCKTMEVVEVGEVEEVMTAEKTAEIAVRVLCAGMSVAISSLAEFAISSAEGYSDLVKHWENNTSNNGAPRIGL